MKLVAIVAHDPNRLIGVNGDLPWHLPGDLAFFKKTTSGHPIVMGRKTFQSIGRALPNRQNIVLTRDRAWSAGNVTVIHDPAALRQLEIAQPDPVFIIGGSEIYRLFLPLLDELLVTKVKKSYQGDTYFPDYEDRFEHDEIVSAEEDYDILRFIKKQA